MIGGLLSLVNFALQISLDLILTRAIQIDAPPGSGVSVPSITSLSRHCPVFVRIWLRKKSSAGRLSWLVKFCDPGTVALKV